MHYQCLPDWRDKPELSRLLDLSNPPKQLYYSGEWNPELFQDCTAVIGSRRITQYGKQAIEKAVPQLVAAGKTIVSGFMYGADQYAHQTALDCGGKTIAVLGWGINRHLEEYDKKLGEAVVSSGGLMLSEWENQIPTLWTFPVRNRIVAALSGDIIVVEAGAKSGTVITVNIARKLHRTLWAVPGPITSRLSETTNQLIAQGIAKPWLGVERVAVKRETGNPLLDMLADEAMSANDVARKLGIPVSDVGAQLSMLSITGEVTERDGKYYVHQD